MPLQDLLLGTSERLDHIALPEPVQAFASPYLTADQLAALDHGPGRVRTRVEMEWFSHASQLNNFALFFAAEGSIAGVIYHRILCNRRFAIVYPAFTDALRANYVTLRDSRVSGDDKERVLLHAYQLMAGLVDRDDPGVRDEHGYICRRYLWQ